MNDDFEIRSVIRTKDDVEFSIGDIYDTEHCGKGWIIREFNVLNNNCYVKDISGHETSNILNIKKVK